jgi:hypothetical protein
MIKVVSMGFSRKRIGRDGKPRYTAYYLEAARIGVVCGVSACLEVRQAQVP